MFLIMNNIFYKGDEPEEKEEEEEEEDMVVCIYCVCLKKNH